MTTPTVSAARLEELATYADIRADEAQRGGSGVCMVEAAELRQVIRDLAATRQALDEAHRLPPPPAQTRRSR